MDEFRTQMQSLFPNAKFEKSTSYFYRISVSFPFSHSLLPIYSNFLKDSFIIRPKSLKLFLFPSLATFCSSLNTYFLFLFVLSDKSALKLTMNDYVSVDNVIDGLLGIGDDDGDAPKAKKKDEKKDKDKDSKKEKDSFRVPLPPFSPFFSFCLLSL